MVLRLAAMSIPLALLLYNVGACLYSALAGTPMQVWAGDSGAIVAIPGVPIEGEPAPPGSRLWWMILGSYGLPLLVLSVVVVRRARAKQRAREAALHEQDLEEEALDEPLEPDPPPAQPMAAPQTALPPLPSGTKRMHLLDPKIVRRMGKVCLIAWGCIGALVLVSWLRGGGPNDLLTESSGSRGNGLIYAGIYGIGFAIVWLGFRWALRTVIIFTPTALVLERGGRRAWVASWNDIRGWRRELGSSGQLRAVVLDCTRGPARRIEMGWLGLGPKSYQELLSEIRVRTGANEGTAVNVKDSRAGPIVAFGIIGAVVLFALLILFFDDIYEKIIYWGIR